MELEREILLKTQKNLKLKIRNVTIEGEVDSPITISAEEIVSLFPSEERIYKLRCVEGWSMVIPWMGFSLSKLLNKVSIKNSAKFC